MLCNQCVNYDGDRCEVKFDDDGDYLTPVDVYTCDEYVETLFRYLEKEEDND